MKILNLSGGGTKIVGIAEAAIAILERGYKPDVITGVSAGAYLALPLAMGLYDQAREMLSKLSLDTMFDPKPVNEKGKITLAAAWRAMKGEYWLGDQRKSLELLRKVINEDMFYCYVNNRNRAKLNYVEYELYPDCHVLSVDLRTGSRRLVNLKDCRYDRAMDFILASGSIPIYTKGVDVGLTVEKESYTGLLFDGGLRNHIASIPIIEYLITSGKKIEQVVSIYARPENNDISEDAHWMPSDVSTSLSRTLDIMSIEISKKDEAMEKLLSKAHDFKLTQVFLPDIMKTVYDTDRGRMETYKLMSQAKGKEAEI